MSAPQEAPSTIVVGSGQIPRGQGGRTLANVPLEWLRKYSSAKPLRRPPAQSRRKK